MNKPPIFNRYYKVVGGDLGAALRAQLDGQREYIKLLETIATELGAIKVHTFVETGKFAGFEFPDGFKIDKSLFIERPTLVFIPKRREFSGFWRMLDRTARRGNTPQDVLPQFGLRAKDWIADQGCRLTGFYSVDVWFVIVPSRHFDAPTLEIAATARSEGVRGTDPINMLWEPPMDWQQITEGQYLNEWDLHYQQELQLALVPKQ